MRFGRVLENALLQSEIRNRQSQSQEHPRPVSSTGSCLRAGEGRSIYFALGDVFSLLRVGSGELRSSQGASGLPRLSTLNTNSLNFSKVAERRGLAPQARRLALVSTEARFACPVDAPFEFYDLRFTRWLA